MIETEERVVEVVREVPVEIVKEVPVYIKVDPAEWDARHGITTQSRGQYGGVGMLVSVNACMHRRKLKKFLGLHQKLRFWMAKILMHIT